MSLEERSNAPRTSAKDSGRVAEHAKHDQTRDQDDREHVSCPVTEVQQQKQTREPESLSVCHLVLVPNPVTDDQEQKHEAEAEAEEPHLKRSHADQLQPEERESRGPRVELTDQRPQQQPEKDDVAAQEDL